MKILLVQLSDLHLQNFDDFIMNNVNKIVSALNHYGKVTEVVIVLSGDLTQRGNKYQFKVVGAFLSRLTAKLKESSIVKEKWINFVVVPGNHDIDMSNGVIEFDKIRQAYKDETVEEIITEELIKLDSFFQFAKRNKCFIDDKIVSYKQLHFKGYKLNFCMINTAPFSMLDSSNEDKGSHFIDVKKLKGKEYHEKYDLNICVMHHNKEWLNDGQKETFRDFIEEYYSIVYIGHEHDGNGESKVVNSGTTAINEIQGNTLSGDINHKAGFITTIIDTDTNEISVDSFIWNGEIFSKTDTIIESIIDKSMRYSDFRLASEFQQSLNVSNGMPVDKFFVFPEMMYNIITTEDEIEVIEVEGIEDLCSLTKEKKRIILSGDSKSGKTTLLKVIYSNLAVKYDVVPVYLGTEDLRKKKLDKVIKYAFEEQYDINGSTFEKYLQLDSKRKVILIDDVNKLEKKTLESLLSYLEDYCSCIIISCDQVFDMNIEKQVADTFSDNAPIRISIRPFMYSKRKELIKRAYGNIKGIDNIEEAKKEIKYINNYINNSVKYFNLDPEFIINFVAQFADKHNLQLDESKDIFSIVYENKIRTSLINYLTPKELNGYYTALQEIAYEMHFSKRVSIRLKDLCIIVEEYNDRYRGEVDSNKLFNAAVKSGILKGDSSAIRFKDKNLLAYFTALALSRKYDTGKVDDKVSYILDNICFGINGDIILFMSLIKNSPRILQIIIQSAKVHFNNIAEFDFYKSNFKFLENTEIENVNQMPNVKDKKEKELRINKSEKYIKENERIDVVDEYDYDEKERLTFENQILISVKYLELLAKILPSFSHNMEIDQQDELLEQIYTYPNKFLFSVFGFIDERFPVMVQNLYDNFIALKKEDDTNGFSKKIIEKRVKDVAANLIVNLYGFVAATSANEKSIKILNEYNYSKSINHSLMNLFMAGKAGYSGDFSEKAIHLFCKSDDVLVKSIIRYAANNYLLDHDVKIINKVQSMCDLLFANEMKKNERYIEMKRRQATKKKLEEVSFNES